MDALAVSAVSGMTQQPRLRQALLLAAAFGGFQGLMPLLGYYAGNWLAVAACLWAPWLGCGLLVAVGGKMLLDSLHGQAQAIIQLTLRLVLLQAVATSIDALAVGLGLAAVGGFRPPLGCTPGWQSRRAWRPDINWYWTENAYLKRPCSKIFSNFTI